MSDFDGSDFEFAFDLVVRDGVGCSFLEPDEVDFDLSSAELLLDLFDRKFRRSAGIFLGEAEGWAAQADDSLRLERNPTRQCGHARQVEIELSVTTMAKCNARMYTMRRVDDVQSNNG